MIKKIVSVLLTALMITASLPIAGMANADDAIVGQVVDPTVYYSDLFWGYAPSYFKTDTLTAYVRDTYDINFRVYAEYLESPDCFWTNIKTSLIAVTDIKQFVGLLSSAYADEDAENVYTYTTALDAANAEIIKRMFADNNSDTFGLASNFASGMEDFFSLFEEFKTDIIGEEALKSMTDEEIYEQLLEFVSSRGLFSTLGNNNVSSVFTTFIQDADKYTKWASAAGSALDAAQVLCVALMAENVRMEVVNGIIEAAPTDSALYDGMCRLRDQLSAGFISYFTSQYLTEEALGLLCDALTDAALGSIAPLWSAVCIVAKLVAFAIPVPTLDEILMQKMLLDYSDTLYDVILARYDGMIYEEMSGFFTAEDVEVFEGIFDMYIIANKCALEASQALALDSNVGDLNYITEKYASFSYDSWIKDIMSTITAIPVAERQYKNYENFFISENVELAYPANELESGKVYLCQNTFRGNMQIGYQRQLTVPAGRRMTIDGNLTVNGYTSVTNNGSLYITGSFRNEGDFTNNGIADIDGVFNSGDTSYSARVTMNDPDAVLYVGGNWISQNDYTDISAGTVVLDGTEQQTVYALKAYNLEVTNPAGIKYLNNIKIVGGEYDLNGNPLDNNGYSTYVRTGTRFAPGSDYKDVCTVYQAAIVLDYPFVGNLTLGGQTSLSIPEGANASIDGNLTANGYSSVTNDGSLHITGNYRSEGVFTNNGEIDVDGDFNAGDTPYSSVITMSEDDTVFTVGGNWTSKPDYTNISAGTVVLDGTEQQTVYALKAYNLEVTNPKGIKYLNNIEIVGGEYDLNGNPLDNNGYSTYARTGTRFAPGSDYKDVFTVYYANLVLDYPFVGNLTLGGQTSLSIPEGANASIDGNLTANGNSSATNDGSLHITGNYRSEGVFTNNGEIDVDGDFNAGDTPYSSVITMSEDDTVFTVGGNWTSKPDYTNISAGTVILDGTEQQTVYALKAYNLEVTNPAGIKYLNNVEIVGGEYDLNGNPLDNNGYSTYARTGTRFAPGSDYKDVFTVYYANLVLDYPFVGNLTLGGQTSLSIPEGANASIDGNLTANGNSSATNDGSLHITGNYRSEGAFTNNGVIDVNGDFNAGDTSYSSVITMSEDDTVFTVGGNWTSKPDYTNISAGTVILDGTEQQTVYALKAYNLEVTNPAGIKYLNNIEIVGGEYDLNGNPLDNNGYSTYVRTGTRFAPGSDYKDVFTVYYANLVLDYPFVGNLTLGGQTSLSIPEGANASIDGDLIANGNSSAMNNGSLHITGNYRSEGTFTNNGNADIDGIFNFGDTSYSTHITMSEDGSTLTVGGNWTSKSDYTNISAGILTFDGSAAQTVNGLYSAPIIVNENTSEEGIIFGTTIRVPTLFDHKGNAFTLYNNGSGSSFNDYDADGLKDNVDPYPTVFEPCLTGHTWGEWTVTVPAACVYEGTKTRTCTGCGTSESEPIPATGEHVWSDWSVVTAPTCVIPGEESRSCTGCGISETAELPATGEHVFGEWQIITPARCESSGEERKFCADCDEYQTKEIPAIGHSWGEWTVTIPARCDVAGEERLFCDNCDETQIREIEPTGHRFGDWIETTPPTEKTEGTETRYCDFCDATETQSIPATGCDHVWGEWTVSVEPTCGTDGEESRLCAGCGITESRVVPKTNDHLWGEEIIEKPATCIDPGSSRSVCEVCGLETTTSLPATDEHSFGEWIVTTPASCETSGEEHRECIFCGEAESKVIPATGTHLWGSWITGDNEKIRVCSACGATQREQVETNPFDDVKEGKWYTSGIVYCYHNGYMAGTSDGVFGYKETVTRAMFATILAKIDGVELSSFTSAPFDDVADGKWYTSAIAWAAENEYAAGIGEGIFGYKNPVTREQIAMFFYVYSEKNGVDVSGRADLSGFTDYHRIHAYALDALSWAVHSGLISGTGETTVSPRDSATRAEIPLIVMNYVENIKNADLEISGEIEYPVQDISGLYKTQGRTIMFEKGLAMLSSADVLEFNAFCEGEASVSFFAEETEDSGSVDVYFTAYVDGERCETRHHINSVGEHELVLATDLEKGSHSFRLVRQTEWNYGDIYVTGINLSGKLLAPPQNKDIYIEFVGDSLTTGFGNLEKTEPGEVWGGEPIYHDATMAYPYMTAEALDADLSVVAIQGIGSRCSRHPFTMNEIYNIYPRVNEKDYTYKEGRPVDIVVINMLSNDGELRAEEKVPPKEIVAAAKELCEIVRAQHPDALIVFAPAFFSKQVSEMIETELGGADKGYYVTDIPLNTDGLAGHPSIEGHEKGTEALTAYLEQLIKETGLR